MKISLTSALLIVAGIAMTGLGLTVWALYSELTNQTSLVTKQAGQLVNKQLEVDALAAEVKNLNKQAQALVNDQLLIANLNIAHQQTETQINEQHLAVMINSNELKVSEHDPTRAWANTALPDAAGQLLQQASGSSHYHSNKDSDGAASGKLSTIGLRTAAL